MPPLRLRVPKNDPVDAIRYLDQIESEVLDQITQARAEVYFEARLEGLFEPTLQAGMTSRKRALRLVRGVNNRLGRPIRWRDGLDLTSTYSAAE